MKCLGKVIRKNKLKSCNKEVLIAFYCKEHWSKHYKKVVAVLIFIGGFIAIVTNFQTVKGWFKTDHEVFIDEKYISGFITPQNTDGTIHIDGGTMSYVVGHLTENQLINSESGFGLACIADTYKGGSKLENNEVDVPADFGIKIRQGKIYFSLLVRDFKTLETIVEIRDNKWILKKDVNDYSDVNKLEITDKYGNIAFSTWIDDSQTIQISGYFAGPICTICLNGHVNSNIQRKDPNYERLCSYEASLLKPHFKKSF